MFRILILLLTIGLAAGCTQPATDSNSAPITAVSPAEIISQSVLFHGGVAYDTANISFEFRDRTYQGNWNRGAYSFEREFQSNGQMVNDLLTNESFERRIDGQIVVVPDTMVPKYSASVNSVWYFALLPYRLLDPAVQADDLGEATIEEKTYHKVKVTFAAEGGGEDFEDVFVYWFDQEDYSLDYLAYSYLEEDGLGIRFRKAINPRRVGSILFQDYINYKADPALFDVQQLDSAFSAGKLDTLSMIELENVAVE